MLLDELYLVFADGWLGLWPLKVHVCNLFTNFVTCTMLNFRISVPIFFALDERMEITDRTQVFCIYKTLSERKARNIFKLANKRVHCI